MKVITEQLLREELRASEPEIFYIPEGKILSPAAREYLQQRKIKISKDKAPAVVATPVPPMPVVASAVEAPRPKFVDYETGAFYMEKPEHMTHLHGNVLVPKNHPRIVFRGKLDSLQALFVLNQAIIQEGGGSQKLLEDLSGIVHVLREMMRCDVLDEPFYNNRILGLSHAELRERSHDPMKFFQIKQMVLPDYTLGKEYALLNQLRTAVRETEVSASEAFREGKKCTRSDLIEELNRLSSAMHIMMCMHLAGLYK
ncbi:ATP-binding protein [Butyricicoccus sp. Marseille-Q5471]|uniref:ATP-binding protein n=1 Tax=Butyricicoccus sp. Marseille-Q5471 TaxID=3039493 RepID=UPI0024BCFD1E|nr:ATP-binding protein [Butyricicoccus sp. Marseille-Q5471]